MSDRESLKGDDYVFSGRACERCPAFLRQWMRDLTYDEFHAMELGLLGVLAALGYHLGYHEFVAYGSAFLVALMFGLGRTFIKGVLGSRFPSAKQAAEENPVARKLIRMEPWYFLIVYLASGFITTVVLTVL